MTAENLKENFLFYTCGDKNKASSRVRAYWLAEELEERGFKCSLEPRHTKSALLLFAVQVCFHDVVVFQKSYSRWHCWLLRWANLLGRKTVLDLDDFPSRTNHPVTLRNVEFMMRNAMDVTVGSRMLFDYASEYAGNVCLVPSGIRLKYYQPVAENDKIQETVCLGWIGNGRHYSKDLISILEEPLAAIAKTYPIRLKIIGACGDKKLHTSFGSIPGVECDLIDQIDWGDPKAVAGSLGDVDIGVYPLLPGGSNEYKCGFKALEYMAMELPVISSNVAGNRNIVEDEVNGFFAERTDDWIKALEMLVKDAALRARMGQAGRRLVKDRYSTKHAVDLLCDLCSG